MPAASASFTTLTSRPVVWLNNLSASTPIHILSMFDAVFTILPRATAGRVSPTGPSTPIWSKT
jgi:hypothetical protein